MKHVSDRMRPQEPSEQNRAVPQPVQDRTVVLTPQMMDDYLASLEQKGRPQDTQRLYMRVLSHFYRDLPEEKCLTRAAVVQWRDGLVEKGYANRTVNTWISVVNNALDFWGHREFQLREPLRSAHVVSPDLTRTEYLRILQIARILNEEEMYLIIKMLVLTGMRARDLSLLRVEDVRQGYLRTAAGGAQVKRFIPHCLREELLDYAGRAGILEGVLFRGKNGVKPIHRSTVSKVLRELCLDARIPVEKGSISCLRRLYQEMQTEIENNIQMLIENAYDRIAEQEQCYAGWKSEGPTEL